MDPVDAYLARLGTAHSRRTVTSAIRCLEQAHGGPIDWATFTYADAMNIRRELSLMPWSWATTCWTVLRQLLVEARALGVVGAGLVTDVLAVPRLRGSAGRLGRDIDDAEIDALFDAIDTASPAGLRDGALLVLLALGGLRRSEAVAVRVDDWCPVTCRLTVVCGKGRRSREVPLPQWAGAMIDDWLAVHPGAGMLLRSVDRWGTIGGPLAVRSAQYLLERLCARAGVPTMSPHALRAHRITAVIDASDLSTARWLAGHSDVGTTSRYDRRGLDHLAAVVDGMDRRRRPPLRVVS
jgi:site-specific recombinase XerC